MKLMSAICQIIREYFCRLLAAARQRRADNAWRKQQQDYNSLLLQSRNKIKLDCRHTREDGSSALVRTSFSPTRGRVDEFVVCQRCQFVSDELEIVDKAPLNSVFEPGPDSRSRDEKIAYKAAFDLPISKLLTLAGGRQ